MKLCSRLLVFLLNLCEKRQISVFEPHFGEVMGYPPPWWLVGKPIVNFVFALIELFSLSITVPELWGLICTCRLFLQGVISLHSNFTWTGSFSSNHSWHQKTKDTGLPDGEDRIPLRSVVLTQYRSVTNGRTDRRTDGRADSLYYMQRLQS